MRRKVFMWGVILMLLCIPSVSGKQNDAAAEELYPTLGRVLAKADIICAGKAIKYDDKK